MGLTTAWEKSLNTIKVRGEKSQHCQAKHKAIIQHHCSLVKKWELLLFLQHQGTVNKSTIFILVWRKKKKTKKLKSKDIKEKPELEWLKMIAPKLIWVEINKRSRISWPISKLETHGLRAICIPMCKMATWPLPLPYPGGNENFLGLLATVHLL